MENGPKCQTTGWSASLAFAPVRRNPVQKSKPIIRLPANASVAAATGGPPTISSTAVVFAPPSLVVEQPQTAELAMLEVHGATQGWGKKVKPPSMVLDEDVNGFKSQQKGGKKSGGGKKHKKVREVCCIVMSFVFRFPHH